MHIKNTFSVNNRASGQANSRQGTLSQVEVDREGQFNDVDLDPSQLSCQFKGKGE